MQIQTAVIALIPPLATDETNVRLQMPDIPVSCESQPTPPHTPKELVLSYVPIASASVVSKPHNWICDDKDSALSPRRSCKCRLYLNAGPSKEGDHAEHRKHAQPTSA